MDERCRHRGRRKKIVENANNYVIIILLPTINFPTLISYVIIIVIYAFKYYLRGFL